MGLAFLLAACGGRVTMSSSDAGTDAGPPTTIAELPVDETLTFAALQGPVDVVRDVYGIPHIYATSVHDLFYAQGIVQSMDRFLQMHLVRLAAAGRTAELAGAFSAEMAVADLEWRLFRIYDTAAEQWAAMDKTSDAAVAVQAFSDGVNEYIVGLQSGRFRLPAALGIFVSALTSLEPWTPEDTLGVVKFYIHSLGYYGDAEILATDLLQRALSTFDGADPVLEPDLAARAGAFADFWRFAPASPGSSILDGFPNMPVDGGTTALTAATAKDRAETRSSRMPVPTWLLRGTLAASRAKRTLPFPVSLGADRGSNNWVVNGTMTTDGFPIVANDPHMQLMNPSVLWLSHLHLDGIDPDRKNVAGAIFPGAPGVAIGFSDHVAWGITVTYQDGYDIYLETIVPCSLGGGDCVLFDGTEVPLETGTEELILGLFGTGIDSIEIAVERVPHHGPVLPYVDEATGDLLPRTMTPDPGSALSARWTGLEPSNEIDAFFGLMTARTIADVENALDSIQAGTLNVVAADDAGDIFFSASSRIPIREAGALDFHATSNPGGNGPMFVLPGDGSAEWTPSDIPESFMPHALNPASGFVASSNNDPVGSTDDNDPLNDPYYTGWDYDLGFRNGRIKAMLTAAAPGSLDLDAMEAMQADAHSNIGALLVPHVISAATRLDEELGSPGAHADLEDLAVELTAAEVETVRDGAALLASWSLDAASGFEDPADAALATDAAATSVFNAWLVHVVRRTLGDELDALGYAPDDADRPAHQRFGRAIVHLFEADTADLAAGVDIDTGDSVLFDDLATIGLAESKDRVTLEALRDAMAWLASPPAAKPDDPPGGFGTTDTSMWRWGALHTLRLEFPLSMGGAGSPLDIPSSNDPEFSNGYPRHGENFTVDVGNAGLWDLDFTYSDGAVMRFVCRVTPDGPEARVVMAGGAVFDPATDHFDDDAQLYFRNLSHAFPFTEAEVVAAAESRIVLSPE